MKHLAALALVLSALTPACASQPPRAPAQAGAAPDINRAAAIRAAREDAARRFGEGWIASIDAAQLGRYWVIELRARDGRGLRYAIALRDGSIRERSIFQ